MDLVGHNNKKLMKKQEEFMKKYVGKPVQIKVDDKLVYSFLYLFPEIYLSLTRS